VPAQARPIYAGRAGGPTGQKLRSGPSPHLGRASPAHNISCRTVLWAPIFVLARKALPIFPALSPPVDFLHATLGVIGLGIVWLRALFVTLFMSRRLPLFVKKARFGNVYPTRALVLLAACRCGHALRRPLHRQWGISHLS
jgi:hypothetical protein